MTSPEITDAAGPLPWDADVDLPEGEQPRANDATGLLPCPFCGGVPHLASEAYSDENPAEVIAPAVINCSGCPATIVESWADEAIASWNRRARAAGVPGEIPDAAVEAAKRRIILEIQLYDFGHTDAEGNFTTTAQKIDLLEERAGKAARAALTAALPHLAAGCTEAVAAGCPPREPTEAMIEAGRDAQRLYDHPRKVWLAMWDAGSALVSAPAATPSKMQSIRAPYTNWRGERANRVFTPIRVWWGSIEWHPEPGLMLKAFDHDKQAERDFAFSGFAAPAAEAEPVAWPELADGVIRAARSLVSRPVELRGPFPIPNEAALRRVAGQPTSAEPAAPSPSQEALREALDALGALSTWISIVADELDLDPDETKVSIKATKADAGQRVVASVSLRDILERADAALAKSAPVKGGE